MASESLKLGKKIRGLREHLGLNQIDFAARLNVRQSAISMWERDQQTPERQQIKQLVMLAREGGFELTYDDFYNGD